MEERPSEHSMRTRTRRGFGLFVVVAVIATLAALQHPLHNWPSDPDPPPPAGRIVVAGYDAVYTLDPITGAATRIANTTEDVCWLKLSPDGGHVAWAEWVNDIGNHLRVVGTNGRQVQLDPPLVPAVTLEWAWRPDNRLVLPKRENGLRTAGWRVVDPTTGRVTDHPDAGFANQFLTVSPALQGNGTLQGNATVCKKTHPSLGRARGSSLSTAQATERS